MRPPHYIQLKYYKEVNILGENLEDNKNDMFGETDNIIVANDIAKILIGDISQKKYLL